jgi:hypothetical protein
MGNDTAFATLSAPRGHKAELVQQLLAAGFRLNSRQTELFPTGTCDAKTATRLIATGWLQPIPNRLRSRPQPTSERIRLTNAQIIRHLSTDQLRAALAASGRPYSHSYGTFAGVYLAPDQIREELFRRGEIAEGVTLTGDHLANVLEQVGPAGSQAHADEARYFETWNERPSSQRVNRAEIDTIDVAPGYRAALVTRHIYTLYHSRLRSSEVEVYLILRDTTSGERHVLRVPPMFGKRTAKTRAKLLSEGGPATVIHAAIAWTFGKKPAEYHPDREA